MKTNTSLNLLLAFILLIISGCKKQKDVDSYTTPIKSVVKAGIPAYVFDWETADYMPTPPGSQPILVPWASGSNQLFPDEIAFDFKKIDGWELAYNTFNPTQLTSPNFFALYNKYRGIIRFYLYIPPGSPNASSYFSDGLGVVGTFNSTIMNLSNEMSDVSTSTPSPPLLYGTPLNPTTSITRIQNYQLQSTGAWYACQYELAYDSKIRQSTQQNLNFVWSVASINLSNIALNGETNGTLTGTVGTESKGGFSLSKLLGQVGQAAVYVAGFKVLDGMKINNPGIAGAVKDGVKGGLSGAVKGIFSAIFGGTPSSPQLVNLTMKTTTNLQGTISSSSGIASPTLAIPGSQIDANTVGNLPAYNDILGVINMATSPVIRFKVDSTKTTRMINGVQYYDYSYTHDLLYSYSANESKILYNPAVTRDGTTIRLLRSDIVVPYNIVKGVYLNPNGNPVITYADTGIPTIQPVFNDPSTLPLYHGLEKVGNANYAVGGGIGPNGDVMFITKSSFTTANGTEKNNINFNGCGIRYTFLVTPSNGASPITIVKTFKALMTRI